MQARSPYLMKGTPKFDARGLQKCVTPGVDLRVRTIGNASADFWRKRDGTLKVRVVWQGYEWSFEARLASGEPILDDQASMDDFAWFVSEELYRWMTEDAADLPPFDDE